MKTKTYKATMASKILALDMHERHLITWLRRTRPTIYTVLDHVSSSGMFRLISLHAVKGKDIIRLNFLVDKLGLYSKDKNRTGLRISGCGMDMGFAIVYDLSSAVFAGKDRSGYQLKQEWI